MALELILEQEFVTVLDNFHSSQKALTTELQAACCGHVGVL